MVELKTDIDIINSRLLTNYNIEDIEIKNNFTISSSNIIININYENENYSTILNISRPNLQLDYSLDYSYYKSNMSISNNSLDLYQYPNEDYNYTTTVYFSKFIDWGFDPNILWILLSLGTNEQINFTHLSNSLSKYTPLSNFDSHKDNENIHLSSLDRYRLNSIPMTLGELDNVSSEVNPIIGNDVVLVKKSGSILWNAVNIDLINGGSGESLFETTTISSNNSPAVVPKKINNIDAKLFIKEDIISTKNVLLFSNGNSQSEEFQYIDEVLLEMYLTTNPKSWKLAKSFIDNISISWDTIVGKPTLFPPSIHTHNIGDINGLNNKFNEYLPLNGGNLTGDLTIKGFGVWHSGNSGTLAFNWNAALIRSSSTVVLYSTGSDIPPQPSPGLDIIELERYLTTNPESWKLAKSYLPSNIIYDGDIRLTNARPASDVYPWAKAAIKPTYTAVEVGALALTGGELSGGLTQVSNNGKNIINRDSNGFYINNINNIGSTTSQFRLWDEGRMTYYSSLIGTQFYDIWTSYNFNPDTKLTINDSWSINNDSISKNEIFFDYSFAGTGKAGSVISGSGLSGRYATQFFGNYLNGNNFYVRTHNGDNNSWNSIRELYHTGNFNPNATVRAANQLEAFTGDDFTGGAHYLKALRDPSGWKTRLWMGYNMGYGQSNSVWVYGSDYAEELYAPNRGDGWLKIGTSNGLLTGVPGYHPTLKASTAVYFDCGGVYCGSIIYPLRKGAFRIADAGNKGIELTHNNSTPATVYCGTVLAAGSVVMYSTT